MRKLLVLVPLLLTLMGCSEPIGTVEGPEWDTIIIDGMEYIPEDSAPAEYDIYSGSDKGSYLGVVESGDQILQVYAIEGDEEQNYLYVRWEWEGDVYIRRDYIEH